MKNHRFRSRPSILAAFAAVLLAGCKEKQQQASPPKPIGPDASFERVVKNLRHYLGQLQTEPISSFENGAFTSISHSLEVTGQELMPPADAKGDYRSQIEVTTKWSYSYQPSIEPESPDSSDNLQAAKRKDSNASAKEFASSGIEVLDSDLISETGEAAGLGANPLLTGSLDTTQSEKLIRKFQFVFKNDRWEFVKETVDKPAEEPEAEKPEEKDPLALEGPDTVLDAVHRSLVIQH